MTNLSIQSNCFLFQHNGLKFQVIKVYYKSLSIMKKSYNKQQTIEKVASVSAFYFPSGILQTVF